MTERHPGAYKRLLAYFAANPDEELTRADIAAKFSISMKSVDGVVKRARRAETLEAVHVYRLPSQKRGAV